MRNVDHFVMTIAPASEGIDGSMATVVLESFSTVSAKYFAYASSASRMLR